MGLFLTIRECSVWTTESLFTTLLWCYRLSVDGECIHLTMTAPVRYQFWRTWGTAAPRLGVSTLYHLKTLDVTFSIWLVYDVFGYSRCLCNLSCGGSPLVEWIWVVLEGFWIYAVNQIGTLSTTNIVIGSFGNGCTQRFAWHHFFVYVPSDSWLHKSVCQLALVDYDDRKRPTTCVNGRTLSPTVALWAFTEFRFQ